MKPNRMLLLACAFAVASPVAGADPRRHRADVGKAETRRLPVAPQQLAPEEAGDRGPLSKYEATVRLVLKEAFRPEVTARAIVYPSFSVEYAVGLRRVAAGWEIFGLHPTSHSVWSYTVLELMRQGRMGSMTMDGKDRTGEAMRDLQKGLPADPMDLPLSRCTLSVDGEVAAAVEAAWRTMLEDVRANPAAEAGADGTSYHFSMDSGARTLAGQIWSPQRGTRPAKLTGLAETMMEQCEKPTPGGGALILGLARGLAPGGAGSPP